MRHTAIAVALLATGCLLETKHAPAYNLNRQAAEQPVCKDEQPTGSIFIRRVCRSPEQRAADEAAKMTWMNRFPANPVLGDMTYPGVDARHPVAQETGDTYDGLPAPPPEQKPTEDPTPPR
jgi:hypothetical protein